LSLNFKTTLLLVRKIIAENRCKYCSINKEGILVIYLIFSVPSSFQALKISLSLNQTYFAQDLSEKEQ
jgi:hypothetical protein